MLPLIPHIGHLTSFASFFCTCVDDLLSFVDDAAVSLKAPTIDLCFFLLFPFGATETSLLLPLPLVSSTLFWGIFLGLFLLPVSVAKGGLEFSLTQRLCVRILWAPFFFMLILSFSGRLISFELLSFCSLRTLNSGLSHCPI